ncbi:MAG TPA: Rieske 2Fe-2S domain-containing protein [Alphaproteobacteria bacterium]|jgi:phenylpropionate dioxygenase-like ring-hydroxylating dioxygenase large terminal subunit
MERLDISELVRGDRVHSRVYTDPAIFAWEQERLFARVWLYLCHDSQLRAAGDFVRATLAGLPVLAVRQQDGSIKALINRCAHRGAEVCQHESGRALRFRCPYHGWTYAADGRLVGVPLRAGYGPGFDLGELSLKSVPRLESYRGFVFASLAAEGPGLLDYLGEMASAIDDIVDRAPDGEVEAAGGLHRHAFHGNWKLQMENLQDYAHPAFAHESSNAAARPYERARTELDEDDIMAANKGADMAWMEKAGVAAYPGGHSYIGALPLEQPMPAEAEAAYRRALVARHGAARTEEILAVQRHVAIVYPTLAFQSALQQIKVIVPVRVDYTEVYVYCFRLKGAPAEYHRAAVTFVNAANSPASLILTDDLAIYDRAQRAMTQAPGWLRFGCGLGRDVPDNRGGMQGPGYSELAMRNQFATWRSYLERPAPRAA